MKPYCPTHDVPLEVDGLHMICPVWLYSENDEVEQWDDSMTPCTYTAPLPEDARMRHLGASSAPRFEGME